MKQASYSRTVTQSEVNTFAEISGDDNPIHVDKEAAEESMFGRRVVHGALTSSYVSAALAGMGDEIVLLSMDMEFHSPVYPGDSVEVVTISIVSLSENKYRVGIDVEVDREDEPTEITSSGEAIVLEM